jgi:hypothetical protein
MSAACIRWQVVLSALLTVALMLFVATASGQSKDCIGSGEGRKCCVNWHSSGACQLYEPAPERAQGSKEDAPRARKIRMAVKLDFIALQEAQGEEASGGPVGAEVFHNDEKVCAGSPCRLSLEVRPDDWSIPLVIRAPGYVDQDLEVPLRAITARPRPGGAFAAHASSQRELTVALRRCPRIALPALPADPVRTQLVLDQRVVGDWSAADAASPDVERRIARALSLPTRLGCDLPEGTYELELKADGYRRRSVSLSLRADETAQVGPELERESGVLLITSAVGGVQVLVDGEVRGELPPATTGEVHLELGDISPGNHRIELAFPGEPHSALGSPKLWGSFPRLQAAVNVADRSATLVSFRPAAARGRFNMPAAWEGNPELLDELCEQDPMYCLAAGWSARWGIGAMPDFPKALAHFRRGCLDSGVSTLSGSAFSPLGNEQANAERELRRSQSCVAYRWMTDVGIARPMGTDMPATCQELALESKDPLAPCVREHLAPAWQAAIDPTLYMADVPPVQAVGLPIFFRAEVALAPSNWGQIKREARLGYGMYFGSSTASFDLTLDAGWSQIMRQNAAVDSPEWQNGWGATYEIGPSLRLAPHVYVLVHGRAGFVHLPGPGQFGGIGGGRLALGVTRGSFVRSTFFAEAGAAIEAMTSNLVGPSDDTLLDDFEKHGDIDLFIERRRRVRDLENGSLSIGGALGLLF